MYTIDGRKWWRPSIDLKNRFGNFDPPDPLSHRNPPVQVTVIELNKWLATRPLMKLVHTKYSSCWQRRREYCVCCFCCGYTINLHYSTKHIVTMWRKLRFFLSTLMWMRNPVKIELMDYCLRTNLWKLRTKKDDNSFMIAVDNWKIVFTISARKCSSSPVKSTH
jgi:hypothetical protein